MKIKLYEYGNYSHSQAPGKMSLHEIIDFSFSDIVLAVKWNGQPSYYVITAYQTEPISRRREGLMAGLNVNLNRSSNSIRQKWQFVREIYM